MQSNDEAAGDEEAADGLVELDDDKSDKGDDEGGKGGGDADASEEDEEETAIGVIVGYMRRCETH